MPPHGGHGTAHSCQGNHDHDETPEIGIEYSLYEKIDKENLECLNELIENSGKKIFKPWTDRLNFDVCVESDADEELLFNIPFTGNIKLKGIMIIGADDESHPSRMRLFKNRPHMTFDDVSSACDQEFELVYNQNGNAEYSTKIVTFSSVYNLSIHFPSNFGAEQTKIFYIGLRGEFSKAHRHGVTICAYEARPNLSDHKNPLDEQVSHQIQ